MIARTDSSSSSAPNVVGLLLSLGLVVTPASGSAAPIAIAQPPTQVQRISVQSNSTIDVVDQPHVARQLIENASRLGPQNRARALLISKLLPSLVTIAGTGGGEVECSWCEDHSLLAEWILPDRRIGFSFEEDESLSSWFIASRPPSPRDGSGYLRDTDPRLVILRGLFLR